MYVYIYIHTHTHTHTKTPVLSSFPSEKQQNKYKKKTSRVLKKRTIAHNFLAGGVTMETSSLKKTGYFFDVNWRVEFGVGQFIVFFFRTYVEGCVFVCV